MDTNDTTVITKAGPEDLIATVWFSMGYRPQESLMIAGLEGPRHRIGSIVRMDLPSPLLSRGRLREALRYALLPITRTQVRSVVGLIASERALDVPPLPIVSALRREATASRLHVVDLLGVTSTVYRSLLCGDHRCCPASGHSLEGVLSSRSAAAHVLNGDTLAASEDELLADVRPDQALGPAPGGPGAGASPGSPTLDPQYRLLEWKRWIAALETVRETPSVPLEMAGFSRALHDPYLRDAVLGYLLGGTDLEVKPLLDGILVLGADEPDQERPDHEGHEGHQGRESGVGPDVSGLFARTPDPARLEPGQVVLAAAARSGRSGDRAPALAVLAMLAWFQGRGARSRLLVEHSQRDFPSHSLARLVDDLLIQQVKPPWRRNGPQR